MPPLDGDPAAIAAGLGLLAAAVWKIRLWLRQDTRHDRSAETQYEAHDTLVEKLRDEVERLYALVGDLGDRLDDEMNMRRAAETEVNRLRMRVEELERRG